MKGMTRRFFGIVVAAYVVCIGSVGNAVTVSAWTFSPPFVLNSEGVLLVNLETDQMIYEKAAQQQFVPASLVKIMTVALALEQLTDLEEKVKATYDVFNDLYGKNASNAGLSPGEELRVIDLMYGTMVRSGCDTAGVLARHVTGGDVEKFVQMMNDKAKEIGAINTIFTDVHGLDDSQQTTSYDMYLITKYALSVAGFEEIATASSYELPPTNVRKKEDGSRYWSHTNKILNASSSFFNPYVKGIKTGTSGVNTQNLVSMAQKNGVKYLLVLMGTPYRDETGKELNDTYRESNKIYQWIFDSFSMRGLAQMGEYYIEVPITLSADKDYVLGTPERTVISLLPNDSKEFNLEKDIEKITTPVENLTAPIEKGKVIGTVKFLYQGEVLDTVNLVASQSVESSLIKQLQQTILSFIQNIWIKILGILLLLLVILYIVVMILYNKKRRAKRNHQFKKKRHIV